MQDNTFFGSCPAGVHRLNPAELIARIEVFGDAFGLGELEGNLFDLLIDLTVDIDEMLYQGVLHQHQREGIRLILL